MTIRPSGQTFNVDVVLAAAYGLHEAFLIHHFQYWIRYNRNMGQNRIEGRTWTYQTMVQIASHFPFLNYEQVKYALDRLEKLGVIKKANYNKSPIDRTTWYAFEDEELYVPIIPGESKNVYDGENSPSTGKIPHWTGKIPSSIPDTKPCPKPPIKPPTNKPAKKGSVGGSSKEDSLNAIVPYECLVPLEIPDIDKRRLTREFSKDLVEKVVKYVTRPKFKVASTLDAAIFYFCRTPEHMNETKEEREAKKARERDELRDTINQRRSQIAQLKRDIWDELKEKSVTFREPSEQTYLEICTFDGRISERIYYTDPQFVNLVEHALWKCDITPKKKQ